MFANDVSRCLFESLTFLYYTIILVIYIQYYFQQNLSLTELTNVSLWFVHEDL